MFVALVLVTSAALLLPAGGTASAMSGVDWSTYGFDLQRSGSNANETVLTPSTVANLQKKWSVDLGDVMIAQPVEAAGVDVSGTPTNLVYVGTEHGDFYAIDASDGSIVWQRNLGSMLTDCNDMPDQVYGIGGSATIDRANGRLFVAGGDGSVYSLDLATGADTAGWPMTGVFDPTVDHVYGGLALDQGTGQLFVTTASYCDFNTYHGRVVDIDVASEAIAHTFYPAGKQVVGGGIWGPGGVSVSPASHHVFAATGNAFPEHYRYSENVMELSSALKVLGANYPHLTGGDVDFGATPILYHAKGCPLQVAAKNKSGVLVTYIAGKIGNGVLQRLQMADVGDWQFNGIPAYSPALRTVYVSNSSDSNKGTFKHGMVALKVGTDCKLHLKWQRTVGPNYTSVSPPTVAGGVVYYGDGFGNTERAFDAATGTQLWNSGSTIQGPLFAAPTVVNGQLYAASWDDSLYAFGLP
jgi:outer membrane protein assembly factor BamB